MSPKHGQLIYEGKAKRIFESDLEDVVLIEFKNDATAFNSLKHEEFEGKGRVNCEISVNLIDLKKSIGIHSN